MQYQLFGNTGMEVSRLSLGAMMLGNQMNDSDSARVIDEALDHGVNLIDTADSYSESEPTVGRVLSPEKRERVYLVSKVYRRFCRDGRVGHNSRVNIHNSLERSLRLLNTDYLDVYLLHHPDPKTPVEETMRTMDRMVEQGKIRYWGVSNHYAWQLAYMLGLSRNRELEPPVCVQSNYSLLERQIETELTPMVERFNLGVMAYGPLCGGVLTGKYHPESGQPASGRADKHKRLQARIADPRVAELIHKLRQWGGEQNLTMSQLSVAWLLQQPWVTTVLLGGTKPEHYTPLYELVDYQMPQDLFEVIEEKTRFRVYDDFANQPFRAGGGLDVNG